MGINTITHTNPHTQQDRDWDEQEIAESTTVVVPFYGLRYAAPLVSAEQRWCVSRRL